MTNQAGVPEETSSRTQRATLSCDYDEHMPGSYRGIVMNYGPASSRFFTGNPYLDRYAARKEAREAGYKISTSSSWDNFIADAVSYFVGIPEEGHVEGGSTKL